MVEVIRKEAKFESFLIILILKINFKFIIQTSGIFTQEND